MRHILGGILACTLAASRLIGGYAYSSTVTFTGASGSTQNNITLLFSFSDTKLKTVANGGQIRNLCSRNGYNVPCDFAFTDDSTCATVTGGYTWGFDGDYSASAGTGHGWVMVPLYTTGGITPTVCIGDASGSAYPGGTVGAEYDSATVAMWQFPNASTLSGVDFSTFGNSGIAAGVSAATGKSDGGANLAGTTSTGVIKTSATGLPIATSDHWTISGWQKTSSYVSLSQVFGFGPGLPFNATPVGAGRYLLQFSGHYYFWGGGADWDTGINYDSDNAFHQWAFTFDGTTLAFYRDGVLAASRSGLPTGMVTANTTITAGGGHSGASSGPNTIVDIARIDSIERSANWIATAYANQNAPSAIGAFTATSPSVSASTPLAGAAVY